MLLTVVLLFLLVIVQTINCLVIGVPSLIWFLRSERINKMKNKILLALIKYIVAAVAGALGMSVIEGCAAVPLFVF